MNDKHRILVISNMVFSETTSNGKTLYSFFESLNEGQVAQLFFSGESPAIEGYQYFRIRDKDVIIGKFLKEKRGGLIRGCQKEANYNSWYNDVNHNHSDLAKICREIAWYKSWESPQLWRWLDEFKPTCVFLLGGDACFAYEISIKIKKRYNCRLGLYITDDYVMYRAKETFTSFLRRKMIRRELVKSLKEVDAFFTISDVMSKQYEKEFKKSSNLLMNMTASMREDELQKESDVYEMVYAGTVYYDRDKQLGMLSRAIEHYNRTTNGKTAHLSIYSNIKLNKGEEETIICGNGTSYGGSLNRIELKRVLNEADVLVFVESWEKENVEKTKYSLSTKVTEYMSLGKPILAIGPKDIGSMEYLEDVAMCVNSEGEMFAKLSDLLASRELQDELASKARKKYLNNNTKEVVTEKFFHQLLGN